MSFYTKFADVETPLTSTTTQTGPNSADVFLAFSQSDKRYHTVPFSAIGGAGFSPLTTSTSTAAPIPATSGSVVITAAASAQFMLSTPAAAGIVMNFFNASSTSTWQAIMSESTSVVFFSGQNGGGFTAGGSNSMQFTCSYQSFGIVSGFSTTGGVAVSTSASWQVTYKSTGVAST